MNIYETAQWLIIGFNSVILVLVCLNLILGKSTWSDVRVRIGVFLAVCGLGAQIIYSLTVLQRNEVPRLAPFWMLKDIGIGILFILDIFKPSVYWTDENQKRGD